MSSSSSSESKSIRDYLVDVLQWYRPGVDGGFFGSLRPTDDIDKLNKKYAENLDTATQEELSRRVKEMLEESDGQLVCKNSKRVDKSNLSEAEETEEAIKQAQIAFVGLCHVLKDGIYPSSFNRLAMNGQSIGDNHLELFGEFLLDPKCPLRSLSLSLTSMTDAGLAKVSVWVQSGRLPLLELDLSMNIFTQVGMTQFANALAAGKPPLLAINLSLQAARLDHDSAEGLGVLEAFKTAAENAPTLSVVTLGYNFIPGYDSDSDDDCDDALKGRELKTELNAVLKSNRKRCGLISSSSSEDDDVFGGSSDDDDDDDEIDSDDFNALVATMKKRQRHD